jgi:hypothetical protein
MKVGIGKFSRHFFEKKKSAKIFPLVLIPGMRLGMILTKGFYKAILDINCYSLAFIYLFIYLHQPSR